MLARNPPSHGVVCHAKPYHQRGKQCQQCLAEKCLILAAETSTTLKNGTHQEVPTQKQNNNLKTVYLT